MAKNHHQYQEQGILKLAKQFSCPSFTLKSRLLENALTKETKDSKDNDRSDSNLLFPGDRLLAAFAITAEEARENSNIVKKILCCICTLCKGINEWNVVEDVEFVETILRSSILRQRLAILAWIGVGCAIRYCHDINTDHMRSFNKFCGGERGAQFLTNSTRLLPHSLPADVLRDGLLKDFERANYLINSVTVEKRNKSHDLTPLDNLPYLNKELEGRGSFGEVWSFDIHPDFCHESLKVGQ